jgi:hypothetical protein
MFIGAVTLWYVADATLRFAGLVVAGVVGIAIAQARWSENRRRARVGLCPQCGYDLRASPERCPECGRVVVSVPAQRGEN